MKISQLGAQLFTLRDYLKTPSQVADTLKKVRQIGYEAVQVSGMCQIDEAELCRMLDGEGLVCAATHEPADMILDQPEKVAERLDKLGCKYTAYPFPAGIEFKTKEDVLGLASKLDAAGKVLYDAGKVLTYHNHSIEFQRIEDHLILDMIYDNTNMKYLQGEIDTYWVQHGGGNPIIWCEKLCERLPLLHMKDYTITERDKPTYVEVGSGNLDWKLIVDAADTAGCEWYLVEQDECSGCPFDALKKSFDYIKANLVD
ncbi:MAG: sugar phosphate isomerase/epimerase family protein [Sedimentisphaeraceae bacterium JB056]